MKLITLFCILFVFIIGCSRQEINLPAAKPEQAGMSSDSLNQVKSVMKRYVDEKKLLGMVTMVARHGKVVNFEKYGLMDTGKPMELNAIFRIASMTKPVTSVAVMILYEEGHFQLDDPVSKYIPELRDLKVFSFTDKNGIHTDDQLKPLTIRNLLTHTSGFASGAEDSPVDSLYRAANLQHGTLKEMIQKLARIPLKYQPGTRWQYSVSTDVLGYLVEVVSGKPLDLFFKERIFTPLKMKDTDYTVPDEKLYRVSRVCGLGANGIEILNIPEINNVSAPLKFKGGNGGLVSTAEDYMVFSQMMLNKGVYNRVRILQSKTVDLMTSNQISGVIMPVDDFQGKLMSGMGYGLGFAIVTDELWTNSAGTPGSFWWAGSGNTYFFIDPEEDLILIFMTQFVPNFYYPVCKEFREMVYRSIID